MSVALLDQGEIVPARGTTSSASPAEPPAAGSIRGPYVNRCLQDLPLRGFQRAGRVYKVNEPRVESPDSGLEPGKPGKEFCDAGTPRGRERLEAAA